MKFSKGSVVLCGNAVLAAMVLGTGRASATLINPLTQFDLIVLGNLTTTSEVGGAAFVGGNLSGTSNYDTQTQSSLPSIQLGSNTYDNLGLTVGGSIGANTNLQINNGSNLLYSGNVGSGVNINMNGGGSKFVNSTISTETSTLSTELNQLSSYFAGLSPNSTYNSSTNTFTTGAGTDGGTAIFNISAAQFAAADTFNLANSTNASYIVINVSGSTASLSSGFNFGSGFSSSANNVLWNFNAASTINLVAQQFIGGILAPSAALANGNQIDGSVGVASFTQNGEVHLPLPTYIPTPEPASVGLMALGGMSLLMKQRRRKV
jgi:choice-of-anchor A domain-containing protein